MLQRSAAYNIDITGRLFVSIGYAGTSELLGVQVRFKNAMPADVLNGGSEVWGYMLFSLARVMTSLNRIVPS